MPIGCPPGPDLELVDQELWDTLSPHVKALWLHNRVAWEAWYDSACGRIRAHDEALDD